MAANVYRGFCINGAAPSYWSELGLLGLSRLQYIVYVFIIREYLSSDDR